jgi:putative ABC transport system permease protein
MVIERNAKNISMRKILGYNDREVSRLYNHATGIVAVGAVILTIPLVEMIFRVIWRYVMFELSGWLTFYEPVSFYVKMVLFGIVSYTLVYLLQMRKVRRIPMGEALKSME